MFVCFHRMNIIYMYVYIMYLLNHLIPILTAKPFKSSAFYRQTLQVFNVVLNVKQTRHMKRKSYSNLLIISNYAYVHVLPLHSLCIERIKRKTNPTKRFLGFLLYYRLVSTVNDHRQRCERQC